jgi:hypothetical protein
MKLRGRPRRRWEDYIKMDLKGIGIEGVDWIGGWKGSRADLNAVRKKELLPLPLIEHRSSSMKLIISVYCRGLECVELYHNPPPPPCSGH